MPRIRCNFLIVPASLLMLVALTPSSVFPRGGANERVPGTTVEILTPTQGVNFTSFVQGLSESVKKTWYAKMPDEAKTQKQKGKVLIRFVVRRDGSLEKGSPLIVTGSGTRKLDDAAFLAIKDAAPFKGFPQEFAGSNIALEFRFFYNLPVE
jgi:TonB family protein